MVEAFVPDDPPRSGTSVDVRELAVDRVVLSVARYDARRSRPPTASSSSSPARAASGSDRGRSAGRRPSSSTPWPPPRASSLEHRWSDWLGGAFTTESNHHVTCLRRAAETGRLRSRLSGEMSQLRLNPLNGRWVTVVAERAERPTDFAPRNRQVEADPLDPCPFCPGNEEATPPALETYGRDGRWVVRIVPNRYPAFYGDDPLAVRNLGPVHVQASASGIHEVLVFSPEHGASWADLDDRDAGLVMAALRDRVEEHARTAERPLHPGHREPRPRGRCVALAPPRPAARHAVRAGRDPRRGAGLRPLRGRLHPVRHRRGRGDRRLPRRATTTTAS